MKSLLPPPEPNVSLNHITSHILGGHLAIGSPLLPRLHPCPRHRLPCYGPSLAMVPPLPTPPSIFGKVDNIHSFWVHVHIMCALLKTTPSALECKCGNPYEIRCPNLGIVVHDLLNLHYLCILLLTTHPFVFHSCEFGLVLLS
jgi:hypothetical protein